MARILYYVVSISMYQFCYLHSQGIFDLFLDQSSYSIGEINITLRCYSLQENWEYMTLQACNRMTNDFEPIVRLNTSGVYWETKGISFTGFSISGRCPITDGCYVEAIIGMHIDRCIDHPQLYPTFRCQFSDGNRISFTPEKSMSLKKGKSPKVMHIPSVISRTKIETEDDLRKFKHVLQLQCTGEVNSINGKPSQDIRWCTRVSGDFTVMTLQDSPYTTTISKSKDGCVIMQRSMIYYSVLGSSNDQIMCESGYQESSTKCGKGSAFSTLHIQTSDLEEDALVKEVRRKSKDIMCCDQSLAFMSTKPLF